MQRFATLCLAFALALGLAESVVAQQAVTIREINDLPDENIQQLIDLGDSVTLEQIEDLTNPPLLGEEVTVTAVVLTNPFNSGVRTWNTDNERPGAIHMFIRDVAAVDDGFEGMTIQISDGSGSVESLLIGDVIQLNAEVDRFELQTQLLPSSFQVIDNVLPGDPLLEPVAVTTDDIHQFIEEGDPFDRMRFRWENYEALTSQYVRLENAQVIQSIRRDDGRPGYIMSSPDTETLLDSYDSSLRFRNDRVGDYQPPYNVRDEDDPFVPPTAGSFINIQGFLVAGTAGFNFPYSSPPAEAFSAVFSISPFEDDDLEQLISAPVISSPNRPNEVLGEGDEFTVSTSVVPDPTRTIASVTLNYELSSGGGVQSVPMTNTEGDIYEATIPAVGDGVFVTYSVTATDNEGLDSTTPETYYRVFFDLVDEIAEVQTTPDGGPGFSPLLGATADMNIEGVVMSDPETSGFLTIQEDESLAPWTGIFVPITVDIANLGLQTGDRVQITNATIGERFDVTELQDATVSFVSSGEPYAYKEVATGTLAQDDGIAEAHEGMALRFLDVAIVEADAGFGEWRFSSSDEANAVLADDASDSIPSDFNSTLTVGQEFGAIQGLWWFSFGNYKLIPESPADLMMTVSNEGEAQAAAFGLQGIYPNPTSSQTTVSFTTTAAERVTLDVYDVLGRRVATLVDGELAPATHTATLDGRGFAGGVYVVRLQAGDRVSTQKLVLVK
jgi:hypothetical protein